MYLIVISLLRYMDPSAMHFPPLASDTFILGCVRDVSVEMMLSESMRD